MNTIDNINKLASQVRKTVKNIHKATYDIRARLIELKDVATTYETTTKALITSAEATLASIPEEAVAELKKIGIDAIQDIIDQASDASIIFNSTIKYSPEKMEELTKVYTTQIYNIENTKNLVNGIKPTLFADNLSALKST